jgi:hypothetical protein
MVGSFSVRSLLRLPDRVVATTGRKRCESCLPWIGIAFSQSADRVFVAARLLGASDLVFAVRFSATERLVGNCSA